MSKYNQILSKLLETPVNLDSQQELVSVYFAPSANNNVSVKDRTQEFHQFLEKELKKVNKFRKPKIVQSILDEARCLLEKTDLKGLAVFGKAGTKILNPKFYSTGLESIPKNQIFISKTYEFTQLLQNVPKKTKSLVLSVDQHFCTAYTLEYGKLNFTGRWQNPSVDDIKIQTSTNGKYGFDWLKAKQDRDLANEKHFLDQIVNHLKKIPTEFQSLIVFNSKKLARVLHHPKNPLHKLNSQIVLKEKVLKDEKRLEQEAITIAESIEAKQQIKLLESAKFQYQKFTSGWTKVLDAAGKAQIDKLFVPANLVKSGWITAGGNIVVETVENAKQVSSVVPWLIQSVLAFGGEVVLVPEGGKEVSARLRF